MEKEALGVYEGMKNILVLGINGFSGRAFQNLVETNRLSEQYKFVFHSRSAVQCRGREGFEIGDLTKTNAVEKMITKFKPSYLLNFVGKIDGGSFDDHYEVNVKISQRILHTCAAANWDIEKILLIGSASEYGVPRTLPVSEEQPANAISNMGITKLLQTEIARYYWRSFKVPVCIARPFNLIGPNMPTSLALGSFADQIKRAKSGGKILTGDLSVRRDFISVQDAVSAYWEILLSGRGGEIYNVCSGRSFTLEDQLLTLIQLSGKSVEVTHDSNLLRKKDVANIYGCCAKLQRDTNWPLPSEDGIERSSWSDFFSDSGLSS